MAFEQGTATNFVDFYNKLRDFLTTNEDLVAVGQQWTQIAGSTDPLTLDDTITVQGPGFAGTDEIRVRLRPVYSAVNDRYNLQLVGVPNWNPLIDQNSQFNMSSAVYIHLWDGSIPYTFVANGRRFVAVAQVSAVVEACYGGFLMPYAMPAEYPYPLVVGGSSTQSTWRFSATDIRHSHFINPSEGSLQLYLPGNTWSAFSNYVVSSGNYSWRAGPNVLPIQNVGNSANSRTGWGRVRECLGGEYPLHPFILVATEPSNARLGELDGCYWVPGIGNSHGNTLDVESPADHMVVQNVTRTDNRLGFWAVKLS